MASLSPEMDSQMATRWLCCSYAWAGMIIKPAWCMGMSHVKWVLWKVS